MAGKPIHRHTLEELEKLLKKHKGNVSAAARELGLHEMSLRNMIRRLRMASTTEERLQQDLLYWRRRAEALAGENRELQSIREHVLGMAKQPAKMPRWTVRPTSPLAEVPVLFTSDFQWGEVVNAEETNGINEYNLEIGRRRYRDLISATINICQRHRGKTGYPGIVYLRGGDSVSGDIHDELIRTNQVSTTMQVFDLLCEEAEGIKKLADAFGKVVVISVPGNHGRTTRKPMAKKYAETNFDHLLSLLLERQFRDVMQDSRVQFFSPVSGDHYFSIYGTNLLLTHGDRIGSSGGQGFIGPAATIVRGVKKTRDQYAKIGKPVDWMLIGHFHSAMMLPGVIANGTLVGYSEYAMTFRADPEPPSQTLFFVNPKWGLSEYKKIVLQEPSGHSGPWFGSRAA